MPGCDIIVVGASAGGVEALKQLVAGLPADLPASVFVVQHLPGEFRSNLPADFGVDHAQIVPGRIYVAPPDYHMFLVDGTVRLNRGPREHSTRPAVDPLFRSAARVYGPRVMGVVLSGALDDGTAGLAAVKTAGGCALVQDPDDALYSSMPENALAVVNVDQVLPARELGPALWRLATDAACAGEKAMTEMTEVQPDDSGQIERDLVAQGRGERPDRPSVLTCPDCGGVLWELQNGELLEFRCHVGHLYSAESLEAAQAAAVESALWAAVRALVEKAVLGERLANRSEAQDRPKSAERFRAQARDSAQAAALLRQVLLGRNGENPAPGG